MRKNHWSFLLLRMGLLVVPIVWGAPAGADNEVVVIVNPSNTVSALPLPDAHKVFLGEKSTWPNGKRITVIMLASGMPERSVILHDVYKMTDNDYSKYFLQATFTGAVTAPPREAGSAAQMKEWVAGNAGAIGYLKKSDVDESVKVVLSFP